MKQTAPTDIYNQQLFDLIPDALQSIIEIGSGSGVLAKAIKHRSPATHYIGIELDPEYSKLSSRYCDLVLTDNIETPSEELRNYIQTTSAIVFSDVLEHLYNPWQTLKFLRSEISKECSIYASIPNIQHWSIIFGLISGNFDYADSGLLDRTHIRFFTKKTIISMFNNCGFEVKSISPRIFNFPEQDKYLSLISEVSEKLKIEKSNAVISSAAFQYTVHAVPV
jgi:2-polyprenyl-3-methyl-5-hydroxy-6-metoxy-1,4-benzoquinol methylase